jgi:hypothetical protein
MIVFFLILENMLVVAPLFLSSCSILFIQIVMLINAFFRVTRLSLSSSSVQNDISRGMQHLKESFLSFSRFLFISDFIAEN